MKNPATLPFDQHDETDLAARMAEVAQAERARARQRDGEYTRKLTPTNGGNPYLSEQNKARAEQQRQAAWAALVRVLRSGEWLDTLTIAERRGHATSFVNTHLNRMHGAGLVEKRLVSASTGGKRAEWRLAKEAKK